MNGNLRIGKGIRIVSLASLAASAMLASGAAGAGTVLLQLTDTVTSNATDSYQVTNAVSPPPASVTQDPTVYPLINDITQSFTIGNSLNGPNALKTLADFGSAATCGSSPCQLWNFQDSFNFTMPQEALATTSAISVNGGSSITNLQIRIINASTVTGSTPQLGTPSGGVVTGDGWQSYPVGGGSYAFTLPANLASTASYIIQVRGEAAPGLSAESYGGTVNFTPVPLPGAAWLLGSGLAGLIGARRRRRTGAVPASA